LAYSTYSYGLQWNPYQWYEKIKSILLSIGLHPSPEEPCLYSGFIQDSSNPSRLLSQHPLCLGLYVGNFVYFSKDPKVKSLFCPLLAERCKVDFIEIVNWFLGVHFSWRIMPSSVSVPLIESGFASNLVETFSMQNRNQATTAAPYWSSIFIDGVALLLKDNDSLSLKQHKDAHQSLTQRIWLACSLYSP
jgi:hypothetical protein